MGREVAGGHLCPGCAHLNETPVDHLQQLQELLVPIVKAASKDDGTDDVGDTAAQEESGFGGGTWVIEIVYLKAIIRSTGCGIIQSWI